MTIEKIIQLAFKELQSRDDTFKDVTDLLQIPSMSRTHRPIIMVYDSKAFFYDVWVQGLKEDATKDLAKTIKDLKINLEGHFKYQFENYNKRKLDDTTKPSFEEDAEV